MTLDQLNAAATQGTLIHHGWGDGSTQMGMTNIFNEDAEVLVMECIPEADAAFIVALWNTYRTGQLVAVADDAVDRVARAIGTSLAYDIGMDVRAGSLTDDEKRKVATKAIAAMKDTQP